MTKIISIANHKGGVGKTTTVSSLGSALAANGKKVLVIDLDAQANLTSSLLGAAEHERTIYHALKEGKSIPIIPVKENLDITPSSLEMAEIELLLAPSIGREYTLKNLLKPIEAKYDFILLDCPPSLGLVVVNAFSASTNVVIPSTAEALPFKGLNMLEGVIQMVQEKINPDLKLSGIVLTRWEGRNLNKAIETSLEQNYGNVLFSTKIRTNITLAEAPLTGKDIFEYGPSSNGAADYKSLAEEFMKKLV